MQESKYIIVDNASNVFAVAFPAFMAHYDFAGMFPMTRIVSAGFMQVENGRVKVWGKSLTLGLSSRPEDALIIERSLAFVQD